MPIGASTHPHTDLEVFVLLHLALQEGADVLEDGVAARVRPRLPAVLQEDLCVRRGEKWSVNMCENEEGCVCSVCVCVRERERGGMRLPLASAPV